MHTTLGRVAARYRCALVALSLGCPAAGLSSAAAGSESCPPPGLRWDFHEIGSDAYALALNEAGYMDIWYWDVTSCHPFASHEMLSGEWAAAIWYEGIPHDGTPSGADTAVWLTDKFYCPDFETNSSFFVLGQATSSNNPENPFPGIDTFRSTIGNGDLEIQLDVELVDLGQCWSHPMGIVPAGLDLDYVSATAQMSLFTYTVKNVSGEPISGIEFYQMLSGHAAGELAAVHTSVYDATAHTLVSEALSNYQPFSPVHASGDFRYDITQWNTLSEGDGPVSDHVDFVGFSSTLEPDAFDNWHFRGEVGRPGAGLHVTIEERDLQERPLWDEDEVAGAMMWYLPTLADQGTSSLTVALMSSTQVEQQHSDCDGDVNGDRYVNQTDLGILLAHYETWVNEAFTNGDLDGDRYVGQSDLGILLPAFGYVCLP